MEAEEGIEPSNDGFANHCLTTWLLRHLSGAGRVGRVERVGCQLLDWSSAGNLAIFSAAGIVNFCPFWGLTFGISFATAVGSSS